MSVSGQSVDPAGFRLRAFEMDWFRPLMNAVPPESLDVNAPTFDAGRWPRSAPPAAFALTLAIEAERWVRLGLQVGYFAEPPDSLDQELTLVAKAADRFVLDAWFPGPPPPEQVELPRFALALAEAREGLTADRQTFLMTMFFESEPMFALRLAEVRDVAEALGDRPWLTLPPRVVDRIAWGLEQPETGDWATDIPSSWRMTYPNAAWDDPKERQRLDVMEPPPRSAIERWRDLQRAQGPILASTDWKLAYEATPQELRPSVARDVHDGENVDDWPPRWARELDA